MLQHLPQGKRADHELLRTMRRLPAQPGVRQSLPAGGRPAETLLLPELYQGLQTGKATGEGDHRHQSGARICSDSSLSVLPELNSFLFFIPPSRLTVHLQPA